PPRLSGRKRSATKREGEDANANANVSDPLARTAGYDDEEQDEDTDEGVPIVAAALRAAATEVAGAGPRRPSGKKALRVRAGQAGSAAKSAGAGEGSGKRKTRKGKGLPEDRRRRGSGSSSSEDAGSRWEPPLLPSAETSSGNSTTGSCDERLRTAHAGDHPASALVAPLDGGQEFGGGGGGSGCEAAVAAALPSPSVLPAAGASFSRKKRKVANAPQEESSATSAEELEIFTPSSVRLPSDVHETAGKPSDTKTGGGENGGGAAVGAVAAGGPRGGAAASTKKVAEPKGNGRGKRPRENDDVGFDENSKIRRRKAISHGGGGGGACSALGANRSDVSVLEAGAQTNNTVAGGNGNEGASESQSHPSRATQLPSTSTTSEDNSDSGGTSADDFAGASAGIVGEHWPHPPCALQAASAGGDGGGPAGRG
ncbi:unnamed protein product, partial [Scytosiphon promiscuus]